MNINFKSSLLSKNLQEVSLFSILQNIKRGDYANQIANLRTLKTKEAQTKAKANLPSFFLSGLFKTTVENKNFIESSYTNLIQIDIDKKDNQHIDIVGLRKDICKLPFVLSCFTSPRGEGLKVIVKHNLEYAHHLTAFAQFEMLFKVQFDVVIDTQCKNIGRAFFVSNDKDLYLNENCTAYYIDAEFLKEVQNTTKHYENTNSNNNVFDFCVQCVQKTCYFVDGNKSKFRLLLSKYLSVYNISDHEIINYITQNYSSSTGSKKTLYDINCGLKYALNEPKKEFVIFEKTSKVKSKTKATEAKAEEVDVEKKALTPFELIIKYVQRLDLKFNEVSKTLFLNGQELDDKELKSLFVDIKLAISKATEKDFLNYVLSSKISYFNPIKEFFENLEHKEGIIEQIYDCIIFDDIAKKKPTLVFFKKWCVGIVAQILGDDNKNMLMPVLIGQGFNYKSSFFEQLLPKELKSLFCSGGLDNGKDSEALMCEKILVLIDDIKPATTKEGANLRSFLSKTEYTYRQPYAVKNSTNKRLASCCATSNYSDVITESQNNRRIIPIKIKTIDIDKYNSIDKTDFIADCYRIFKTSKDRFDWELTKEEASGLSVLSTEYEQDNSELGIIKLYFTPASQDVPNAIFMQVSEMYNMITTYQAYKEITARKVGMLLSEENSGFKRVSARVNGQAKYGYYVVPLMRVETVQE